MCCTGAHLLAKTGKEKRLPTTATAQKMPAMDNLRMFDFFHYDHSLMGSTEEQGALEREKKRRRPIGCLRLKQQVCKLPTAALSASG